MKFIKMKEKKATTNYYWLTPFDINVLSLLCHLSNQYLN